MPRLLTVTVTELTRDLRARRAALEGRGRGFDVVGLCVAGGVPITLASVEVVRVGGGRVSAALWIGGLRGMRREDVYRSLLGSESQSEHARVRVTA